jgi:protein-S-isoprenylcysteine O-methyltransferase Ste14
MKRLSTVGYGVVSYLAFVIAFLYAIGFIGNFGVPRSIDTGRTASVVPAVIINLVLLSVFAVQHSVMARPAFKRWWTQIVPQAVERSTYVLLSSLALFLLFWQWRSLPAVVWDVESAAGRLLLWVLFWVGWATVLSSTFMINHFDLFGLRQVYLAWRGEPYTELRFRMTLLYRVVRHPLMLGFVIAFWATPTMSTGHLLFAAVSTAYILVAVQLEERDLVAQLGDPYRDYRRRVSMLVPWPRRSGRDAAPRIRHRAA